MFLMAVGLSLGALLLGAMADRLRKCNIRTEVLLAGVGALFIVAELALVLLIPLPSLLPWSIVSIAGAATVLSFAVSDVPAVVVTPFFRSKRWPSHPATPEPR